MINELKQIITKGSLLLNDQLNKIETHKLLEVVRTNSSGDKVKFIDEIANKIFLDLFKQSNNFCGVSSEEEDNIILFDNHNGKYVVVMDPLDGSNNVNPNITIGSIFGVYKMVGLSPTEEDFLQKGSELVCAAYTIHGPQLSAVIAHNNEVIEYNLHYLNKTRKLNYNNNINIISLNSCNYNCWNFKIKNWFAEHVLHNSKYTYRYIGSLVSEVNNMIVNGGLYAYPSDHKNKYGKLRLVYECIPMAFIIKSCGGVVTNGKEDLLTIKPKTLHEKSPLWISNNIDIINQFNDYD